eukprot:6189546-Pleurochrysis_carterae.AAC.2
MSEKTNRNSDERAIGCLPGAMKRATSANSVSQVWEEENSNQMIASTPRKERLPPRASRRSSARLHA